MNFFKQMASWCATVALALTPALIPMSAQAHGELTFEKPKPNVAPTPPMGWNSWNHFACNIDEAKIRGAADGARADTASLFA